MKLLSLNLWGGKCFDELIAYIKEQAISTDIFCFQEVFSSQSSTHPTIEIPDLQQRLVSTLPQFQTFYSPAMDIGDTGAQWGLSIFVRDTIEITNQDNSFVFGQRERIETKNSLLHPRNLQHVELLINGQSLHIYNVHGLWTPDKLDNPDRLEQSARIIKQIESHPGATILCGDFNLRPETESIKMLEKNLTNLITTNHISTTRSSLYTGNEPFADYTFVSSEIHVKSFALPDLPVSDHCPMVMDFEI